MIDYELSGTLCLLRLNRPPLNTMDDRLLTALVEAIARAEDDPQVEAVVITGQPDHFSAGADIHLFQQITSADDARRISERFQAAFQAVENSPKPVACALAGRVMGGALELAMACHRRVATPDAQFSLPEIRLGILPGAGGTQRLPRLVGPAQALEMMLTGRPIRADRAQQVGLIDAVAEPDELIECARCLVGPGQPCRQTSDLDQHATEQEIAAALENSQRLVDKAPPELLAPARIVTAVTTGLRDSFPAGIEAECEAFAECMQTPAAQNRIYVFFATRQTAKLPELSDIKPAEIKSAAVVGMGSMGTGIAQALATAGVPVAVVDQSAEVVEKALGRIRKSLERRVTDGKWTPEQAQAALQRITPAHDIAAVAQADLIIESVFEMLDVKQTVLGQIEAACRDDALVATNTSTLSLDSLAAAMRLPERLVGMHFFNPAHRMPLVEIIRRAETPAAVVATTLAFAKQLKKTPVVVNNREGFLVNRVFVPYLVEAFTLLEEGADPRHIDAAMVAFGFPMGPLTLSDLTGIDIVVHAHRELHQAFPYHGPISPVAHRLVDQGRTGQKSGAGVYRYEPGNREALDDETLGEVIRAIHQDSAITPRAFDREEITQRLVGRMVAEAFRVLEEDVARSAADLDAAMVLGTGFPDYRGGILRYAQDRGLDTVLAELDNRSRQCSERYAPSRRLREMAGE